MSSAVGVAIRDGTPSDARAIADVMTIYLLPDVTGQGIVPIVRYAVDL